MGNGRATASKLTEWWPMASKFIALFIAITVGALYVQENRIYTRHLEWLPTSELRQVASLQTENGFYYSYYRELVNAESFWDGLKDIIWDKRSEYPDVLNAMRRFNIFQEIFQAFAYRQLRMLGLVSNDAWEFFRFNVYVLNGFGHTALSLLASEVSGNPFAGICFYVYAVLTRFETSRLGSYPSLNLREQYGMPLLWMQTLCIWHLLQGYDYNGSHMRPPRRRLWCCFIALTFLFIISWQFSPFMLLLQAAALYFVYLVLGYRGLRPVIVGIINTYIGCIAAAFVMHFGSPYLITSPFLYELAGLKVATLLISRQCSSAAAQGRGCMNGGVAFVRRRIIDVVEGLLALVVFAAVMKAMAPFATADTHVYEILCTKSKDVNSWLPTRLQLPKSRLPECAEPSFNARLYLIMGVFNVLEDSSFALYKKSTSGPASIIACSLILARCLCSLFGRCRCGRGRGGAEEKGQTGSSGGARERGQAAQAVSGQSKDDSGLRRRKGQDSGGPQQRSDQDDKSGDKSFKNDGGTAESSEEAALLFFALQFILFFGLGMLVNRLRVAFGPPMMVLAASVFGPRVFPLQSFLAHQRTRTFILIGVMIGFCVHVSTLSSMFPCVGENDGICSQLSEKKGTDGDLADLMSWVNEDLPLNQSILSSMNLAGTMRAFTNHPMIVHPQFESENLRKRVQLAYELYHCGSEESFAHTMRKLHATVAIFEYARCFFTPYTLDDRRKNCNEQKHKQEDLLCVKLHAKSRLFKVLFINGGYAVVQLRDNPLPPEKEERTPEVIAKLLEKRSTWKEYIDECQRTQPTCGARLVEAAATWHHSLKRQQPALTIRHIANELYPEDGYVAYSIGRHLDYDQEKTERAGHYYEKAAKLLPDNLGIVKEYLMWLDVVAKDADKGRKLLEARRAKPGKKRKSTSLTPFLELEGAGSYEMLCEAGVSAMQQGLQEWGQAMWDRALREAPLQRCIETNWGFVHPNTEYSSVFTREAKVWHYMKTGQVHEIAPHHSPNVRFLGNVNFTLNPDRR